jgi:hypothetical protein
MASIPEAVYSTGRKVTVLVPGGLLEETIANLAVETDVSGAYGVAWDDLAQARRDMDDDEVTAAGFEQATNRAVVAFGELVADPLDVVPVVLPTTDAASLARQILTEIVRHGTDVDERNVLEHLDAMRDQFADLIAAKRAKQQPRSGLVLVGGESR